MRKKIILQMYFEGCVILYYILYIVL